MTKKGTQEDNFIFLKDRTGKFGIHKTLIPIIECVREFEILVVPDLKAMKRATKNPVTKHKKACSKKLTDLLTKQVLIVASNNA